MDQLEAGEVRIHCLATAPPEMPELQHSTGGLFFVELCKSHGHHRSDKVDSGVLPRPSPIARVEYTAVDLVVEW